MIPAKVHLPQSEKALDQRRHPLLLFPIPDSPSYSGIFSLSDHTPLLLTVLLYMELIRQEDDPQFKENASPVTYYHSGASGHFRPRSGSFDFDNYHIHHTFNTPRPVADSTTRGYTIAASEALPIH